MPFSDVPRGAFFFDAVAWAYENGITTGIAGTDRFNPGGDVTRGQFVTFLYRLEGEPSVGGGSRFNDVTNRGRFYFNAVAWASSSEITTGYRDGTFRPNNPITREEMTVMMYRYANYRNADLTFTPVAFNRFTDRRTVSWWAVNAMQWATHHEVITGSNGRLSPRNNTTRGQMVTVLHRAVIGGVLDEVYNYVNPLTGLPSRTDIAGFRPVAVSIGNNSAALPTMAINGISQADIIYEVLVEDDYTRFIAIYQDFSNVGVVGSIRSVRPYTLDITESFDAMVIHAHGTPFARDEIERREITNFDGRAGNRQRMFVRNRYRIPRHPVGEYYSITTSGELAMLSLRPRHGIRYTHREGFEQELRFTDNPIPSGGNRARTVEITFPASRNKVSSFTFLPQEDLYIMRQAMSHSSPIGSLRDANNNVPVSFANLLILRMDVAPSEDPRDIRGDNYDDRHARLAIDTVGEGTGYFVSHGRFVTINWSRECEDSQFVYTFEDGSPVELGIGKTYIGIVPMDVSVSIR